MLRCVVREDLSYEMATDLINDMNKCIEWLDHHFIYSGQFDALSTCRLCYHWVLITQHVGIITSLLHSSKFGGATKTEGTNAEMQQSNLCF